MKLNSFVILFCRKITLGSMHWTVMVWKCARKLMHVCKKNHNHISIFQRQTFPCPGVWGQAAPWWSGVTWICTGKKYTPHILIINSSHLIIIDIIYTCIYCSLIFLGGFMGVFLIKKNKNIVYNIIELLTSTLNYWMNLNELNYVCMIIIII